MKLKTSITLSEELVKMVDRAAAKGEARSQVLERLLREALAARARREADKCVFRPKSAPIPLAKRHSFRLKSALVPMQIGTPFRVS